MRPCAVVPPAARKLSLHACVLFDDILSVACPCVKQYKHKHYLHSMPALLSVGLILQHLPLPMQVFWSCLG